jgi:hypothetical protein
MNDIHEASNKFKFILYADDTSLFSSFDIFKENGHTSQSESINNELSKIYDWLTVNKLSLNAKKSKFIVLRHTQNKLNEADIPQICINNEIVERVANFNFLGLTINEHLNWAPHISKISCKISRTLGIMKRLKNYLPLSILKLMYDSLILSHLQFNITAWGFESKRIFKLQKRAIRTICNTRYNAHTGPLFKQLNILKITDIFNIQCLKFWYRYTNSMLPAYFSDMFTHNYDVYDISTRQRQNLRSINTRTKSARHVIRHYIPTIIHTFPSNLICKATTHTITAFTYNIKQYIIDNYVSGCDIPDCYVCNNVSMTV